MGCEAHSQPNHLDYEHTHAYGKQPVGQPFRQEYVRNLAVFGAAIFSHGPQRASPAIKDQHYTLDEMGTHGDKQYPIEDGGDRRIDVVDETGEHEPEGD